MKVADMMDLKGKVAIVTGGGGIFGKQICRTIVEMGARLSITHFLPAEIEFSNQLVREGYDSESIFMDLASEESIKSYRDHVIEKYGKVDILINCAVVRAGGDIEHTTKEQWEFTSKNNSTGLFLMCKYFLEPMVAAKAGVILNIGSIQACVGPNFRFTETPG